MLPISPSVFSWSDYYPNYEERMAHIARAARYWFEHGSDLTLA